MLLAVMRATLTACIALLGLAGCSLGADEEPETVEAFFEDCKSSLGMTQYETRSWAGWHHHMTLVGPHPTLATPAAK